MPLRGTVSSALAAPHLNKYCTAVIAVASSRCFQHPVQADVVRSINWVSAASQHLVSHRYVVAGGTESYATPAVVTRLQAITLQ